MREFKFRAWDKYHGEMINWGQYKYELVSNDFIENGKGPLEIMQYTGLKDKNGKEIYEGDIIENNENGLDGPIEWKDNGWKIKGTIERRYEEETWIEIKYVEIQSEPDDKRWGLKVIGNIFENPELLSEVQ